MGYAEVQRFSIPFGYCYLFKDLYTFKNNLIRRQENKLCRCRFLACYGKKKEETNESIPEQF